MSGLSSDWRAVQGIGSVQPSRQLEISPPVIGISVRHLHQPKPWRHVGTLLAGLPPGCAAGFSERIQNRPPPSCVARRPGAALSMLPALRPRVQVVSHGSTLPVRPEKSDGRESRDSDGRPSPGTCLPAPHTYARPRSHGQPSHMLRFSKPPLQTSPAQRTRAERPGRRRPGRTRCRWGIEHLTQLKHVKRRHVKQGGVHDGKRTHPAYPARARAS